MFRAWLFQIPYTLRASLTTLSGATVIGLNAMAALDVFLEHPRASLCPAGLLAPRCLLKQRLARAELGGHVGGSRAGLQGLEARTVFGLEFLLPRALLDG